MIRKGKKGGVGKKVQNLALAGVGGVLANVATKMAGKIPGADTNPTIPAAAPFVLAFFAADFNEPFAYGMAGASGANIGRNFGIGDLDEDDLSGIFEDPAETLNGPGGTLQDEAEDEFN